MFHINSFVRRQTASSSFTHFEGSFEELAEITAEAFQSGSYKQGYRVGVILVRVSPERFRTGIVKLVEGDKLEGEYKARREGEEPRLELRVIREGGKKDQAKLVDVVCYAHDVLAEGNDAESEEPWEIIAINGYPTQDEAPIQPTTLMHNHFGSDGGTSTNMTPEQFEAALRESFAYWKDRGMLK